MTKTKAQKNAQRGNTIRLLRKIHGWLGLWGAILGLLFGVSGFLLNHRAVMKIPAVQMEETEIQLAVSTPYPTDVKAFTRFIQTSLNIGAEPVKPKPGKGGKPERDAKFMDKDIKQPQAFNIDFQLPQARIEAEYIVGNQFATVKRQDANLWGFLTRMHKGVGANTGWILLVDSIAGAMLVLSITGVLLWTKMRQSRLILSGLMGVSTILAVWFTLMMM
ncbi:PepSY-associated TM helix domain-containing protein [Methylotenera versatilis]|uniref:PepSY-associated TM helix domain-containing protein n=1 Tax=Methylotenera versatilis TaxID=1055487 RepID=UPI0006455737|nr:PepSY-associated TM helix domain-containing protein [Methylotenera versatilis]